MKTTTLPCSQPGAEPHQPVLGAGAGRHAAHHPARAGAPPEAHGQQRLRQRALQAALPRGLGAHPQITVCDSIYVIIISCFYFFSYYVFIKFSFARCENRFTRLLFPLFFFFVTRVKLK